MVGSRMRSRTFEHWSDPWAFNDRPMDFPYPHNVLRRLDAAANCGALGAAVDAMLLCQEHTMPPPAGALLWLASAITGGFPTVARGRFASPADEHKQNIIHRVRHLAVRSLAEVREAEREERKGADETPPLWRMLVNAGLGQAEARRAASEAGRRFTARLVKGDRYRVVQEHVLKGTPAGYGERDAVKRSFDLVQAAADDDQLARFYLPSDSALEMMGWGDLAGLPRLIDRRIGGMFSTVTPDVTDTAT